MDLHGSASRPNKQINSAAAAASEVMVTGGGCIVLGLTITNTLGTATYVQVHDAAALPDNDAVPDLTIPIGANASESIQFPLVMANGLTLAASSTPEKLTADADARFLAVASLRVMH
jgi:hypothetical protein